MMLPILTSVSLAPGSYFFWALADVAISAAAAKVATAAKCRGRASIVFSPFVVLFCGKFRKSRLHWQGPRYSARRNSIVARRQL
jgi:hypothetical protein